MYKQKPSSTQDNETGLSRRILMYVVICSTLLALVTISIHYQHVKNQFFQAMEEQLQVIENGLLPALATEAYDDNDEELFMTLRAVTQIQGVQYVQLFSNIPGHQRQMEAGNADRPYDDMRRWPLPQAYHQPQTDTASYLVAYISYQHIQDRLRIESGKMLLIAAHQILILSIIYFAIFHLSITRHLSCLAKHLKQLHTGNLTMPIDCMRKRSNQPRHKSDELDLIGRSIEELCSNLHEEIQRREQTMEQLAGSEEFYRQIVEDQTEFVCRVTLDGKVTFVNSALCKFMGLSREEMLNSSPGDPFTNEVLKYIQLMIPQFSISEPTTSNEFYTTVRSLGQRLVSWKSRAFYDEQGRIVQIQGTGRDITEQAAALQELRLRDLAVRSAPNGIAIADAKLPDLPAVYVNPAFEKMSGYTPSEIIGRNMRFLHRDDVDQPGLSQLRQAIRDQTQAMVTIRNYRKDGSMYWVELIIAPMHDDDGNLTHFISIQTDVTQRMQADERQKLLMHELDHRVKNVLATVIALASQSMRTCPNMPAFKEVFTGRIQAMARAHEALASEKWEGIYMGKLVELVLGHQLFATPDRIKTAGSNVRLESRLCSPLCMVLHELLTNALKYGALKNPQGHLTLSWEETMLNDSPAVELTWREYCPVCKNCCDGTHVPGTGMKLIQGLVSYEMNGTVEHTFTDLGLFCRITIPICKNIDPS